MRSALSIHTFLRDSHWAGSSQLASSRLQRRFPICSWIFSHLPSFLPVSKSALPSPLLSSQLFKIYHTRPTGISRPSPSPPTRWRPLAHFQLGEIKPCDPSQLCLLPHELHVCSDRERQSLWLSSLLGPAEEGEEARLYTLFPFSEVGKRRRLGC